MGKHRTLAEKQELIKQFQESGLIKSEFCRQQGISENVLYSAIKHHSPELLSRSKKDSPQQNEAKFIPVVRSSPPTRMNKGSQSFFLYVQSGIKMEFPDGFNLSYLSKLIKVIN